MVGFLPSNTLALPRSEPRSLFNNYRFSLVSSLLVLYFKLVPLIKLHIFLTFLRHFFLSLTMDLDESTEQ